MAAEAGNLFRRIGEVRQFAVGFKAETLGHVEGIAPDERRRNEGHTAQTPKSCLAMMFFCTSLLPP